MKHIMRTALFVSVITLLAVGVFPVAAQINTVNGGDFGLVKGENVSDLSTYITNIISIFLGLVAVVAVIFIIYAGIQLVTSEGEQSKMEKAKHTILYAVIGLIIIGLAAVMVRFTVDAIHNKTSSGGGASSGAGLL